MKIFAPNITNNIALVAQDVTLQASVVLCLVNEPTKKRYWCEVYRDLGLTDWAVFPFTVVPAGADPQQSQIALRKDQKGDYTLEIYTAATYSENPNVLTLIHTERAKFTD